MPAGSSRATGLLRPKGRVKIVLWWRRATRAIIAILRRRRAWAEEGLALQADWIQNLVDGLERHKGVLVRTVRAPVSGQNPREPIRRQLRREHQSTRAAAKAR